ncbi:hypothetical protein [Salinicoccus halodurans]|uniref:Uncharacterized protein n=1 Tax=Salinicoccus halodurans TaxID=407035 RepID=A0A0F7HK18_9STAP|nr:hypothetical protein [Salinicoccus halodurans]AKG74183.1 hypothetical protein AAT16_08015 [Salinicoccus halodurans]SFK61676.1 hypothetical protein SAMN05216235_0851 [Salinicoccus halodurans]
MELHINVAYILLNQNLLHDMVTGNIDRDDTVYYTMKNNQIDNYYADINDVPGQVTGMLTAFELSETLLNSQFR